MSIDRLNKILSNNENITKEDINFLEYLTVKYPYFQLPKILHLKGLKKHW